MSPIALKFPTIRGFIELIWEERPRIGARSSGSDDPVEDDRNRRAFIQEVLGRNPDAFASDLDVQNMMQMYPGSY